MRFTLVIALTLTLLTALPSPQSPVRAADQAADEEKSIQLPTIAPDLPDAKGLTTVNAACVLCHSTRYITMQPAFPRKTWAATVDKMRKTFGAPLSDEQATEIVDYLVAVRGVKDVPAK